MNWSPWTCIPGLKLLQEDAGTFDATQADLKGGYVAVGYGRDATDVAVYNQFGPAVYLISQTIDVERIRD